jgi:hypothetical protein
VRYRPLYDSSSPGGLIVPHMYILFSEPIIL